MSSSLSSGMAVDDLPEVTEPPRDGMSIHEVKQVQNELFKYGCNLTSISARTCW